MSYRTASGGPDLTRLRNYRTLQSEQTITSLEGEALTMEVRSVQAVFEDGVLRPSEDLGLQEHERVRLIVTSEAERQRKVAALLE